MADDIKKKKIENIIHFIEIFKDNSRQYKNKTAKWSSEFGIYEELGEAEGNLWKNYANYENLPDKVLDSIEASSSELANQSERFKEMLLNSGIDKALSSTTTASISIYGVSRSAMADTHSINQGYLYCIRRADEIVEQLNQQEEISQRLGLIDSNLKSVYDNAWANLRTSIDDITRSPMLLMREVFRRVVKHFAPDEEVRKFKGLQSQDKVKRSYRINYIVGKLESWNKNSFTTQIDSLRKTYKLLSKAHTPKELNAERTKGYLYQASALIKFLLDHFT